MLNKFPAVSIGMPVYNGAETIGRVLESLAHQSFPDFELIISDNNSTDDTAAICIDYAKKDSRVRYFRQSENIGSGLNFKFVLDQASAPYFMWAAADDIRSADWVQVNYEFLRANPRYVASTSPNGFEGSSLNSADLVKFSLEGEACNRLRRFFDHCWLSHGIFYSLIRTEVLRGCEVIGRSFIAADWAIDLYLARQGEIYRTSKGITIFGVHGVSNGTDAYKAFRNSRIELLFPFVEMTWYAFGLTRGLPVLCRAQMIWILTRFNVLVAFGQIRSGLHFVYRAIFKPVEGASRSPTGGKDC